MLDKLLFGEIMNELLVKIDFSSKEKLKDAVNSLLRVGELVLTFVPSEVGQKVLKEFKDWESQPWFYDVIVFTVNKFGLGK